MSYEEDAGLCGEDELAEARLDGHLVGFKEGYQLGYDAGYHQGRIDGIDEAKQVLIDTRKELMNKGDKKVTE